MGFELIEKKNDCIIVETNRITFKDVTNSIKNGSIDLINDGVKGVLVTMIPIVGVISAYFYFHEEVDEAKELLHDIGDVLDKLYGIV